LEFAGRLGEGKVTLDDTGQEVRGEAFESFAVIQDLLPDHPCQPQVEPLGYLLLPNF
jgi:hypothetical protein